MQIKNDSSSSFMLIDFIENFYKQKDRWCKFIIETNDEDSYMLNFLIDRKHIIQYSIPIQTRNAVAMLLVGVGPCFVTPSSLMNFGDKQFSMNATTEAVEHNLQLIDEYFVKQSCCTCCKCQRP